MSLHNEDISQAVIAGNNLLKNRENNWKISIPGKATWLTWVQKYIIYLPEYSIHLWQI
jgi:hypothetical protein